jgi:hypothetical protein
MLQPKKRIKLMRQFRQGDVLLIEVNSIPFTKIQPIEEENGRVVLAHGEVTGHHHSFKGSNRISFFRADEGEGGRYLTIKDSSADLVHQEHDTIQVPAGNYKVVQQRTYTPTKNQIVAD